MTSTKDALGNEYSFTYAIDDSKSHYKDAFNWLWLGIPQKTDREFCNLSIHKYGWRIFITAQFWISWCAPSGRFAGNPDIQSLENSLQVEKLFVVYHWLLKDKLFSMCQES